MMNCIQHPSRNPLRRASLPGLHALLLGTLILGGCTHLALPSEPTKEFVWAVTARHQLIRFNAGQPEKLLEQKPLSGLSPDEHLAGIDYRVARGVLYGLTDRGRLYTIDTSTGVLRSVGDGSASLDLRGRQVGFDFNPTVDRIRVVDDSGRNLRLHPETGAQVDGDTGTPGVQPDGRLSYDANDSTARQAPRLIGAGYTYNQKDDKLTTNFAIDGAQGTLVTQGSREGIEPLISPNSGRLFTVGPLGLGPLETASFDISDIRNLALAAVTTPADSQTRLYRLDLQSGKAALMGRIGDGEALRGIAIEP